MVDFGMSWELMYALKAAYPEEYAEKVAEEMCWWCLEHRTIWEAERHG